MTFRSVSLTIRLPWLVSTVRKTAYVPKLPMKIEKKKWLQRGHPPTFLIIWWGIEFKGASEIHFCQKKVRTMKSSPVYKAKEQPFGKGVMGSIHGPSINHIGEILL
ncbi:hypothetical protein TNCV_2886481 [Trichonephila clavipes]|nr:hypothetical protein TNCV_2886481 [Trichonephila clavipes]